MTTTVIAKREPACGFPKSALWDSRLMLDGITIEDLNITDKLLDRMHDLFWSDMQ